jgi:hypothetical protein
MGETDFGKKTTLNDGTTNGLDKTDITGNNLY